MPEAAAVEPAAESVPRLAEHLFRQEAGKLVSVLTGIFGLARLQMAEDVVQEAMVRALQTWPFYGVPANPAAWLMQTAKHLALDLVRREKVFRDKEPEIVATMEQRLSSGADPELRFDDELQDQRLRLIFACCQPLLPREAQIALALKTLCGFSPAEIARAFFSTEAAVEKRLVRARQFIREQQIPFEIPSGVELAPRLDAVLQTLYLFFNEGYKASAGENLIRADLCYEAIRLTQLLAEHPATSRPRTHALLALMLLNAARLPGRTDAAGQILRLHEQDRQAWDRRLIALGIAHLGQAATGADLSEYHVQAGIAACHCTAPDYRSTNWRAILGHYDRWRNFSDSPLVALNRAVALAELEGPAAGIHAVESIPQRQKLESYYLTHAVLGDFHAREQHLVEAAHAFRKALALTEVTSERAFLQRRLDECEAAGL